MTANPHTLRALRDRLCASKGSDRELDAEIWWAFADHSETDGDVRANAEALGVAAALDRWCGRTWRGYGQPVATVTASVDAALALAERVLPATKAFAPGSPPSSGWKMTIYRGMTPTSEPHACWEANVRPHGRDGFTADAPTAPLALLAALLQAKIAELEASDADR